MTIAEFKRTLTLDQPPAEVPPLLAALWHDANGDWEMAHNIAQEVETSQGSWVHAYLHRKEGDRSNASYWYARAGKPFPPHDLAAEWEEITKSLLRTTD